jgi:glycosyltransferase involved in cell wall biosynthesis
MTRNAALERTGALPSTGLTEKHSDEVSHVSSKDRVVIVQYAGDYREAVNRLWSGGPETYYAQRYSVESVADIGKRVGEMTVLACVTSEPYDEMLVNGVRGLGAGFNERVSARQVVRLVGKLRPTRLVICTPIRPLLRWAIRNRIRTLALFADSFQGETWRARFGNYRLARLLNDPGIEWVANHNINAARCLESIGIKPDKIIPWDWIPIVTPRQFTAKTLRAGSTSHRAIYVGQISEQKGVGDLLRSVSLLKQRGINFSVRLAGKGDTARFLDLARHLNVENQTEFLGLVPHDRIVDLMRDSDVVVVPSRHECPEGLPLTIYEGLCSRTPIVASDHPMFRGKVVDRVSALVFPGGNVTVLADQLARLAVDADLYRMLSSNSEAAWTNLQIPVKFADLISHWVSDKQEDKEWLAGFRLASGRYNEMA